MEKDGSVAPPKPGPMEDRSKDRTDLDPRVAAAGEDAGLQQPRVQDAGDHGPQPVNDYMKGDSPVASPTPEPKEAQSETLLNPDSRGRAGPGEDAGRHKLHPNPKDRVPPADQGVPATSPESRARWSASDAEDGPPVPEHDPLLVPRWSGYTLEQQQDSTGVKHNVFEAADNLKAAEDKQVQVQEATKQGIKPVDVNINEGIPAPSPTSDSTTKDENKDPTDLDSRATAARGEDAGLQQLREQETEKQGAQPVSANMNEDSPVPSPTPEPTTKDESRDSSDLDSRGVAAALGENAERTKIEAAPKDPVPSADQDVSATSPDSSRARWGASNAEDRQPVPEHRPILGFRWSGYTLEQQRDSAGDEQKILEVADAIKAAEDKPIEAMDWFDRVVLHVKKSLGMGSSQEAGDDSSTEKHVLVFGSSGTGKTSFVNALTGGDMPTGDGARGVTLEYNEVSVSRNGVDYRLVDTAGLDEADKGGVSAEAAMTALVQLLKRTEGGLNLMVMVVQKGRIHESTLSNYKLFVETLTSKAVPLIIVVTHCEREDGDMQGWVDANRQDFLSRGIKAVKMVAATFVTPNAQIDNIEAMNRKVRQSVCLSWGAIHECTTPKRVDFMKLHGGFLGVTRQMYNSIARHVGAGAEWVSDAYANLIQKSGGC